MMCQFFAGCVVGAFVMFLALALCWVAGEADKDRE
jgi:hypothetical protein